MSAQLTLDYKTVHRRFGHCSHRRLMRLREQASNFPQFRDTHDTPEEP